MRLDVVARPDYFSLIVGKSKFLFLGHEHMSEKVSHGDAAKASPEGDVRPKASTSPPQPRIVLSLRHSLLALVLLAVLPALALILHTAAVQRRLASQTVQHDALRLARVSAAQQERLVEGAHQLLVALAQVPVLRGQDPAAANALLARLLTKYSGYANIGIIDMDGSVFASGLPVSPQVNLKDRLYFRRAVETGDFAMGEYQIGRITHVSSVNFGYPLVDNAGRITRVAFAALDLAWLSQLGAKAELPEGGTLTVVDAYGTVLAGWPDPEAWRGRSIANDPVTKVMLKKRDGTEEVVGSDGISRLVAFVPIEGAPGAGLVSVSIAIPKHIALAEPNRMLRRNLAWLALVAALALGATWIGGDFFILRRARALVRAAQQLEAGDLTARTGLTYGREELGRLAHAFDRMANSLQLRSAERDLAEKQLRELNAELEERVASRTAELRAKNEQLEADQDLARKFQLGLLPNRYPEFPPNVADGQRKLRFCHRYEPSGAVGGDYFTVLPLSPTRAGIFVCDVMGHGVRAALVTAIIRGLVEELAPVANDPGRFLSEINTSLAHVLRDSGTTMFASALYAIVDTEPGSLQCSSAGHPKPLLLRRATGSVETVPFPPQAVGPALGLFGDETFASIGAELMPDDIVVIYTDGISEAAAPEGEPFGEERLCATFERNLKQPLDELLMQAMEDARKFTASATFEDDVCLVGVELTTS